MKNPTKKQLESEIADLKKVVNNPDTPENILNAVKPTLAKLEKLLENLDKAEKQDTKIQAQAKVVTAKAEKIMKAGKVSSTKKAKAPVAKAPEVKKVNIAAARSKKKVSDIASEAKKLLSGLAPKIKSFNAGRSEEDLERDQDRRANKPGWKKSKTTGKWYFEDRPNRTDASGRKKPYLEDGGEVESLSTDELLELANSDPKKAKQIWNSYDLKTKKQFKKECIEGDAASEGVYEGFIYLINSKEDGGEVEIMADGGQVQHTIYNYLIVDLDERGEYAASVYNERGDMVWDCNTESVAELIEDGFIKHKPYDDLNNLRDYLKSLKILPPVSELLSESDFYKLNNDDDNYAKGGLFKQSAPQGESYRWQNDKAVDKSAKPVGWRYTDEGAKRLGVSANKIPTQAHIDKFKDKTFIIKGEKHRFVYEETRKDKSDVDQRKHLARGGDVAAFIGQGENIDVFGYQTKHFIDCPSAVEQFSAAMDTIENQYKPGDQYYDKMKAALSTMAEKVDTLFSLEHFYAKREMETDSFTRISQLLVQIGVYNYKSGLNVNTEFLGRHLEMFCHYSKAISKRKQPVGYAKGGKVGGFNYDAIEGKEYIIDDKEKFSPGGKTKVIGYKTKVDNTTGIYANKDVVAFDIMHHWFA